MWISGITGIEKNKTTTILKKHFLFILPQGAEGLAERS